MPFPLELDGVKQGMTRHRWPLELSMRNKKAQKPQTIKFRKIYPERSIQDQVRSRNIQIFIQICVR